jgi:DNA gyrase subunit B
MYAYNDEEKARLLGTDAIVAEGEEVVEGEGETEEEEEGGGGDQEWTKEYAFSDIRDLGEMNAEELWETTMNPANRVLKQVSIVDAIDADKVFDILMGTDVSSRKVFYSVECTLTANLDV